MKDARGHGSNPHGHAGVHGETIRALPRNVGVRVERTDFKPVRTAAGQLDTRAGAVWQKVSSPKRRAVAERIAQLQRIDNPNALIRVRR